MIQIVVSVQTSAAWIETQRLQDAVKNVLGDAGRHRAEISIAIVDGGKMRELNRQFLQHDYDTDVLSFVLEDDGDCLEGEIIVSADMANTTAERFGWTPGDELLLYVIHGALHLTGLDDHSDEERRTMRQHEQEQLSRFGLRPQYDDQELGAGERHGGGPR